MEACTVVEKPRLDECHISAPSLAVPTVRSDFCVRKDFQLYGRQSSAYFIFQDDVCCFESSLGGRVHYAVQSTPLGAVNIVFTNPLCARTRMKGLLEEFLDSQSQPCVFVAVDKEVAMILDDLGYRQNEIGTENKLPLDRFDLHGKQKKQLRHAANFGKRTGASVHELSFDSLDQGDIEDISLGWRHNKRIKARELRYATRPPIHRQEWKVRKFYCLLDERIVAYVYFDPYFENGKVKGYCANILRAIPDKGLNGALDYVILEAMAQFKKEGVEELSLGVAPLNGIQKTESERKSIRLVSRLLYQYGSHLYSFKGLAYHKSRYRPEQSPWYLCTKEISLFRLYWALLFGLNALG